MRSIRLKIHRQYLFWQMFLPVVLLAMMLFWITTVIYSGSFDSQPALRGQFQLIDRALLANQRQDAQGNRDIVVVNITDTDTKSLSSLRHLKSGLIDPSILSYAAIIDKILKAKPFFLMVRWIPEVHQGVDENYDILAKVFEKHEVIDKEVYLAVPQNGFFAVPQALKKSVKVIDDDLCTSISQMCPYVAEWDDWAPQIAINSVENRYPDARLGDWQHTRSLNTTYPSYILNLLPANRLLTYDVKELLQTEPELHGKFVFLGRDIRQLVGPELSENSISQMTTIYNKSQPDLYGQTTPLHVFWAQISEMVLSKNVPYIPLLNVQVCVILAISLLLALVVFYLSIEISIFIFIVLIVVVLNINYVSLRYFNLYVPVLNLLYFSLISFVLFNFLRVLYTSYLLISEKVNREQYTRADHIQTNFLSLLSHNLITPVARMQASVDQLQIDCDEPNLKRVFSLQKKLLTLESCLKAMLLRMSLTKYQNLSTPSNMKTMLDIFNSKYASKISKQAVSIDVEIDDSHELAQLPLHLDADLWASFWFYLALTTGRLYKAEHISVSWELVHLESQGLHCVRASIYLMKNDELLDVDYDILVRYLRAQEQADDFFIKLYCNTLHEIVEALDSIEYLVSANHLTVELRLSNM